jgi:ADP-heptose:LPS heptosyltransferase
MIKKIKDLFKIVNCDKNTDNVFVIISMAYFGDSLVGNSLFQNIKMLYPNAKTVFIINKPYYEVAKYQKDVDEVYVFDTKCEHKGFLGMLKFIKQFPYKNIKYIFKMCDKSRVDVLSILLNPKKIINYKHDITIPTHERYCNLLKKVTNEKILKLPIVYNADNNIPVKFQNIITKDKKYIAICTTASNIARDMPIKTMVTLAKSLNNDNFEIILVGVGKRAQKHSEELKNNDCKFIDLVEKTSIYELAQCLRNCEALISVDTGTMHLGYANNVPTVCVFYVKENIKAWAPDKTLYPHTILPTNNTPEDIYESCIEIIKQNS